MDPDRLRRLEELAGRHLDGRLDAAETAELSALLAAEPEARRTFARSIAYDTALPRALPRRRAAIPLWPLLAAAAALVIGAGLWWLLPGGPDGPRIAPGGDAVVVRAGAELAPAAAGALRRGDEVRCGSGGAAIVWSSEASRLELSGGARLALAEPGPRKDLELRSGDLVMDAAPQGAGGLVVRAGAMAVTVVGTRFRVASANGGGTVAVEHGTVSVSAGGLRRAVGAGQVAVAGAAGRLWVSPAGDQSAARMLSGGARIDAAAWQAVAGRGWTGTLRGDDLAAQVEATAERVENPERREGYALLTPDLAIQADVTLAHPGTLAVFVICRLPDGHDWLGNYTVQQVVPAGRFQRTWTLADLRVEKGAPLADALGGRIVKITVCGWNQPVGLAVHRVAVGPAAALSRP